MCIAGRGYLLFGHMDRVLLDGRMLALSHSRRSGRASYKISLADSERDVEIIPDDHESLRDLLWAVGVEKVCDKQKGIEHLDACSTCRVISRYVGFEIAMYLATVESLPVSFGSYQIDVTCSLRHPPP